MTPRILAALLVLALPATTHAQESSAAAGTLAELVVAYPDFRAAVADSFRADLPEGAAVEIGLALLNREEALWSSIENDVATRLAAAMGPVELQAAAESFERSPEAEWELGRDVYLALGYDVMTEDTETGHRVGVVACTAGIFGTNIDLARQKAAETGQTIVIDDAFLQHIAPILESARVTCTCMLERTQEEFGDEFMGESEAANEEQKRFAQQLVASGECPNPFAGLPQGG